jgi:anti-sigma factor (TIGR02949 family)
MRNTGESTYCDEVCEVLEPYLDGDLPRDEAERVRAHVASCAACAAELALAEAVQRELRALPELDCPPEVLERIRASRPQGAEVVPLRRAWQPSRAARIASIAAALALTVGGTAFLLQPRPPAQPSAAEVARATEEARFALAYLGQVNRKAGLDLREDVFEKRLVAPAAENVSRSLEALPRASSSSQEVVP